MRGTVRGVRNRVRAGIATFLQDQTAKVSHQRFGPLLPTTITLHGFITLQVLRRLVI